MCEKCDQYGKCNMDCEKEIMIKNVLVQIIKLSQITCGFYMNTKFIFDNQTGKEKKEVNIITFKENPKLNLLIEIINNIPPDKKVIIWSNFISGIKLIANKLEIISGANSFITIYGNDDAFKKVKEFGNNPKIRWLVTNQQKVAVGLNIQFSCYEIFFSNSYSYVLRDHAESRQHRKGQKEKVTIIDLLCEKTINEKTLQMLENKKDLATNLMSLARVSGINIKSIKRK